MVQFSFPYESFPDALFVSDYNDLYAVKMIKLIKYKSLGIQRGWVITTGGIILHQSAFTRVMRFNS